MPRRNIVRTVSPLLLILLTLAACHHAAGGSKLYDQITHGLGIGVNFGASPDQVHAILGQPVATVAPKGEQVTQDFWASANPDGTMPGLPDPDATQLSVTYYNGKLVQLYNRYHPETPDAKSPPFVAEPVFGVKLGDKRSQFELALGKANYGKLKDSWRFAGKDGSAVVVIPEYSKLGTQSDEVCSALSLQYIAAGSASGTGEYYEKQQKKQDFIHHLGGK